MSLKAIATSRCSLAPVTSARASSSPSSTRRAVRASARSGRASEPASTQASARPSASATSPTPITTRTFRRTRSPTESTLWVTRTAPSAEDRHRRVQELAAERGAVPCSLLGPARERCGDLGAIAVRGQAKAGAGRVGDEPSLGVDHDHPGAEVTARLPDELAQPGGVSSLCGRGCRDHLRLRRGLCLHLGVDAAREAEHEWDLEHDQDEHEHVGERRQQFQPEAQRSSSGEAKRKPTPRTVWM